MEVYGSVMWRGVTGDQRREEMLNCVDTGKVDWRWGECAELLGKYD